MSRTCREAVEFFEFFCDPDNPVSFLVGIGSNWAAMRVASAERTVDFDTKRDDDDKEESVCFLFLSEGDGQS